MTTTIRSRADGSKSYIAVGGTDVVTVGTQGIEAGSFKPGAITANDFADGALIENAPVGIGYGTGAGGTVTQATSKVTAVTLNKPCGRITTHNAALDYGDNAPFVVNNSLVSAGDTVAVSVDNNANYIALLLYTTVGSFRISLVNIYPSTTSLSEAVGINFTVIKGVNS